jgi:hypothetical protein
MEANRYAKTAVCLSALIVSLLGASSAASAATEQAREVSTLPNRSMLFGGIVMLGLPYAASAVVASQSTHPGDSRLYLPVVGPWLDLANRGGCPIGSSECMGETINKGLLIGSGVLQGLGALQILGAFVFPERNVVGVRVAATKVTPEMVISPASIGPGAWGLTASGTF